ncbi:unnamed protein product [Albugo candida]|uniref:Uncharacterized protein n=1 Tax=Albugo candida TaxID=65357 RepID=A0A024FUJ4_9STRA|nr:unnamed protein product [Albugo candida]|eukprot:CCI10711.1 unnamed protein product [Albugo candida]
MTKASEKALEQERSYKQIKATRVPILCLICLRTDHDDLVGREEIASMMPVNTCFEQNASGRICFQKLHIMTNVNAFEIFVDAIFLTVLRSIVESDLKFFMNDTF